MKRIDTTNVRENLFGAGKHGFHDNADLPGHDATYLSPEWFNNVQEELCNLLELNGISLDTTSKRQIYDLLTTQVDLEALASEIETNFIRKNQIVDDLTTSDATKPVSAKQAKYLQDNKLNKEDLKDSTTTQKGVVQLNNTLNSNSTAQALTAIQGKILNDQAFGIRQTWKDMSSNRVLGTTYTNTSGKPIQLYVSTFNTRSGVSAEGLNVTIDGVAMLFQSGGLDVDGAVKEASANIVIPIGSTYLVTSLTNGTKRMWWELS
ncbi:hypothetical protein B9T31_04220 [Acinetobacter sp. ANC 4558]|uniref:phage tail protein n=1 Tax=Acinetobacter sp. ANC 4558 TaxID=1977876 RepID=UPI000A35922B|nr:phage tail protein [Acinetobacter sp. ANC 4558]OTG87709.1 hypothetical protein B9T31_04220 [Acinetobacter sp. ANC 4558]